jgi:hypothetical protein
MSGLLQHEHYMRRAIELGQKAFQMPFGAVVVDKHSGKIVAQGWNRSLENPILGGIPVPTRQRTSAWHSRPVYGVRE